jgi:hypothetical protein
MKRLVGHSTQEASRYRSGVTQLVCGDQEHCRKAHNVLVGGKEFEKLVTPAELIKAKDENQAI